MFNGVKAIFVDSEGTIRDNNRVISDETIKVINDLEKKGIHVIITSGLPRFIVEKIKIKAMASNYIIASNGADIYDTLSNQKIGAYYLNHDLIKTLWKEYGNKFTFILGNGIEEYATDVSEYNQKPIMINEDNVNNDFYQCHISQKRFDKTNTNVKEELQKLKKYFRENTCETVENYFLYYKMLDNLDNLNTHDIEILVRLKRFLELQALQKDIVGSYSNLVSIANQSVDFITFQNEGETPWFSLNDSKVCKGEGIKNMANYLNIKKENIMAIGNDYNDRTMINEAGLFICPSTSIDYIIKRSDYVYDEKEGISKVLRKVYDNNG